MKEKTKSKMKNISLITKLREIMKKWSERNEAK